MSLRRHALLLAATMPVVACSGPQPAPMDGNIAEAGAATNATPIASPPASSDTAPANDLATASTQADYVGRWIGVEGMVLDVTAKPGGGMKIENQWDLDHKGSFDGSVTAEGLRWMRGEEAVTAVRSDGAATGLKYLVGKKDCLTVKPGEGYCRD